MIFIKVPSIPPPFSHYLSIDSLSHWFSHFSQHSPMLYHITYLYLLPLLYMLMEGPKSEGFFFTNSTLDIDH